MMAQAQDELLRRPLYLYHLPQEVISSLSLKADVDSPDDQTLHPIPDAPLERGPTTPADGVVGSSQACSLCSLTFPTVQDQRGHQKSDLHHYNLKQKLRGLSPVSEAEFEKLVGDLDESLSGSDSDDSEDEDDGVGAWKDTTLSALLKKQATLAEKNCAAQNAGDEDGAFGRRPRRSGRPPLIWFSSPLLPEKTYFGIYRAIFTQDEADREDEIINAVNRRQLAPISMPKPTEDGMPVPGFSYKGPHILLCMIGGGHFAAMVVSLAPRQGSSKHGAAGAGPLNKEAVVLAHKTFHRYTTRRKQGGSQSANDNAKGAAHSAGSSLRRYNEQALVEDVRSLLGDWKPLIDSADLLFIRATGSTNRRTLFGPYDGQVLRASDPRIRGFPFSTRRATQSELMRAFIELTRLKVREIEQAAMPTPPTTTAQKATTSSKTSQAAPKLTEEEEMALLHTQQIQAMIRRSRLPALLGYLKTNDVSAATFRFHPPDSQQNYHAPTPLHLAAAHNCAPLVLGLLTRGGADPTARSAEGRTPFELAGDRATRDAFRVARSELGEAAWAWDDGGGVPAPLTREEADRRAEREKKEEERRRVEAVDKLRAEEDRARKEGEKCGDGGEGGGGGGLAGLMKAVAQAKSAQEKREEETRGLTPQQQMRLDRERRARAAEERLRRMQQGAGGP